MCRDSRDFLSKPRLWRDDSRSCVLVIDGTSSAEGNTTAGMSRREDYASNLEVKSRSQLTARREVYSTRPMPILGKDAPKGEARGEGQSCERQKRAEMGDWGR